MTDKYPCVRQCLRPNLETALGVTKGDGSERPASGGRVTRGTRQKRGLTALE